MSVVQWVIKPDHRRPYLLRVQFRGLPTRYVTSKAPSPLKRRGSQVADDHPENTKTRNSFNFSTYELPFFPFVCIDCLEASTFRNPCAFLTASGQLERLIYVGTIEWEFRYSNNSSRASQRLIRNHWNMRSKHEFSSGRFKMENWRKRESRKLIFYSELLVIDRIKALQKSL